MTEKTQTNGTLTAIAWGAFVTILGAGWLASAYYQMDTGIYIALGVGFILIALNLVRIASKITVSKFSLFIGLLAIALSGSGIAGFALPFIPTIIVLVGLFIVAEAIQKTTTQKTIQA